MSSFVPGFYAHGFSCHAHGFRRGGGFHGAEAVHANGFAALKELEYFMQPRFIATTDEETSEYSTHEFNWDGTPQPVEAPPFSTVYMLDKENMAGERIDRIHRYIPDDR